MTKKSVISMSVMLNASVEVCKEGHKYVSRAKCQY